MTQGAGSPASDGCRPGRLAGKVVLVTGADGHLGGAIVRRCLEEDARVAMVGRQRAGLEAARARIAQALGRELPDAEVLLLPFDAADPAQARRCVERVVRKLGRLDVLVNNAGSTGLRQPLVDLPLTRAEVEALRAGGASDTETVGEAITNVFGLVWHMCRAVAPHLQPGASVVNVSTIFSRTRYYGRSAYVVPKAALNAFSHHLALQLGARCIRVNVVYPGPVEGVRIHEAFAAMDGLKQVPTGTTAQEFLGTMALARDDGMGELQPAFPSVEDVANTIVFLGSDESRAFSAHGFEVTNGMDVPQESRSTLMSRPDLRTLDGHGATVLVLAGDQVADALAIARVQAGLGAKVLLGLGSAEAVAAARVALGADGAARVRAATPASGRDGQIEPLLFERDRADAVEELLAATGAQFTATRGALHGAVVLPASGAARFRGALLEASDADVDAFLGSELAGTIAIARELTRFWKRSAVRGAAPRAIFVSNGDDGAGNAHADILRAAVEALVRVWRDESGRQARSGARAAVEWSNQILRWSSADTESLPFTAGAVARLLFMNRRIPQICLYTPAHIAEVTGAQRSMPGWTESLTGLHLGKCVLITGGSAGIGGQLARLLAIAGAKVMITARRPEPLLAMRAAIVRELEEIGYYPAQERVQLLAGVDVGDEAALQRALEATLRAFGRIDYLVNNAGITGGERMVVDLDPDTWRATLRTNLASNYSLIEKAVPLMKAQGGGYILNVSSYFGGEKHIAVPYPNRADYAVSKAGQRALVENLARFVGPEIQINAIAPGPVDGQRLRGAEGQPGLFDRRAQLIVETRRLNALHAAVLDALDEGHALDEVLRELATNDVGRLAHSVSAPAPLRLLAARIVAEDDGPGGSEHSSRRFLVTAVLAARLVARLRNGGALVEPGALPRAESWAAGLPEPPQPFADPDAVRAESARIRDGVLRMLYLHRMPNETDVALATVFFMADRAISGETFEPSGGLQQERKVTERELFGRASPGRVRRMEGETVWLLGEHMVEPLATAARCFLDEGRVGSLVVLTRSRRCGEAIRAALGTAPGLDRLSFLAIGDDLEAGFDLALQSGGTPAAVVSTPFRPLPAALFDGGGNAPRLDAAGFAELVESQLTQHFRVARRVSLFRGARLVLCSPDVPVGGTLAQFALANFVKTTLHALTATLGVENERLPGAVPVNQVNLTRRMRSEEPRDAAEQAEEYERFAQAVLLAASPAVDAQESRYRSRIQRGLAITV